ncbi:MAG: acetylserotonin O-methyltransferase [bacterium]|nr:acetylserotonin O-methyltransferase [bacterium]
MTRTGERALAFPATDPTLIFEHFRGSFGSQLLTVAVAHLDLFTLLAETPLTLEELQQATGLARRPAIVLTTAMRAMQLLQRDSTGKLSPTEMAREHLVQSAPFDVGDYLGLAANEPGVMAMAERLRTNLPAGSGDTDGTAFIYRRGQASAMEESGLARHFTLALAGRANNVAPHLAAKLPIENASTLLDVGGGTGIYSVALLQQHPQLKAIVLDRPEVLRIAAEFAAERGVNHRMQFVAADMFHDPLPTADLVLLSNILHDWDEPECADLTRRCADSLTEGGRLVIHDVFLNDELDGPLPIALYSAALFTLTEGRAYSRQEYRKWMEQAGLQVEQQSRDTLIHCGMLVGRRSGINH